MPNPYIDKIIKNPKNKSKKKGYTLKVWIIIISSLLCASFIAFLLPNFIIVDQKCFCCYLETDAQNTIAAIASYFSEPEHSVNDVPTFQNLVENEGLTINKNHTVIISGPIRITVIDNEGNCRRGKKYVLELGEDWLTWRDSATWYSE